MFPDQRTAIRVGLWALAAAVVAALLVLALHGRALAAEPVDLAAAARVLAQREPLTPDERLAQADALIEADRRRRSQHAWNAVLRTGLRLAERASPRRALRSAHGALERIAALWERSPVEDGALEILEGGGRGVAASAAFEDRYRELRYRERRQLARRSTEAAADALAVGRTRLARLRVERALELEPELADARALLGRLERGVGFGSFAGPYTESSRDSRGGPGAREIAGAPLAAALLAGDYERALVLEARTPGDALARGAALYLGGDRPAARDAFAALASRADGVGAAARRLAASPELDPESQLERALSRYRLERALDWVGGEELAARARLDAGGGYRSWRESLGAIDLRALPWRAYRAGQGDTGALREAALRYLERSPEGALAPRARELVATLPPDRPREWDDGRFALPRSRTSYASLMPESVLITQAALASAGSELDGVDLDGAQALVLMPARLDAGTGALPPERAAHLLAEAADGLESGSLAPLGRSRESALDAIRRLDRAARRGLVAVTARPWSEPEHASSLRAALLDGEPASVAGVETRRRDSELQLARSFEPAGLACPARMACIHREPRVDGGLYGRFELGSDFRIGAFTRFHQAQLMLQVSHRGPQASLVVPLGRWLGLERWLPIEAHLDLGVHGVSVGPRLAKLEPN